MFWSDHYVQNADGYEVMRGNGFMIIEITFAFLLLIFVILYLG